MMCRKPFLTQLTHFLVLFMLQLLFRYGHEEAVTAVACLDRERAVSTGGCDHSLRYWKVCTLYINVCMHMCVRVSV